MGQTQPEGQVSATPDLHLQSSHSAQGNSGFGYCTTRMQAPSFLITVTLYCRETGWKNFKSHKPQNEIISCH